MSSKKLLLIGWDAADWKVIHPLLDSGKMPHLYSLIKKGGMGNLASLRPELSPMLWTSIATGKRPYKHGILGFTEPGPDGKGMRPVTNLSRKTKTIWNILNQNGYRSLVVGWWPSHPAEPINGVMVSNHYQRAHSPYGSPWPMPAGAIHPARLNKNLAALRVHPQEVDPGLMQLFVPALATVDQKKDPRIESLAKIIADATTINRAATALMHHEEWDFAAVYFDAIDHFCHGFMNYHPPYLSWVKKEDYQLYKEVVVSGYIFHDILLGSLLAETDKDTTIILVSDHGFHSDHLRPARIPGEPAGPAAQHRPYGIVVVSGPAMKKDELLYGSSLLDICPTILSLFDLPVADDMDGKVLVTAFVESPDVEHIPSWDDVPGEDGSHPSTSFVDPLESSEAINRLVELGYIEKPDRDQKKAAEHAKREIHYNLARSYMDAGLHGEALSLLTELIEQWPDEYRFGIELAHCYQATGCPAMSRPILSDIFARKKRHVKEAEEELKNLRKEIALAVTNEEKREELQQRIPSLLQKASQNPYGISYLLGVACHAEGDCAKALAYFDRAEKGNLVSAPLFVQKGSVYEELKQWGTAEKQYQRALSIDAENTDAMLGLCRLKLAGRQDKEAAHQALDIIALRYHSPLAHFYLGCALHRLGRLSDAIQALELAVRQNPNIPEAYHRLAYIYSKRLQLSEKATFYKGMAKEARQRIRLLKKGLLASTSEMGRPVSELFGSQSHQAPGEEQKPMALDEIEQTIVVVSGLPRSGTSMVMQMLAAGGFPVLTDRMRGADEDNPKGYFEYEGVKGLSGDNSWLLGHGGKAVKIIAPLLPFLPMTDALQYRIVFVERNLDEILLSQEKMLLAGSEKRKRTPQPLLRNGFFRQVEKIKALNAAHGIPVLYVQHHDCINSPSAVAVRINLFLGGLLDETAMVGVVDASLYRNRKEGMQVSLGKV
ncbi:MAG: alkaline phosphatase family protein [Proteobacteria bacterium]|nr:alkaline phosphatase family protein [Pseudomonadota bacterium]